MLGRLVMGIAGDRVGNKRAMIVCFIILVAVLAWLQVSKEVWMLYLFAVAYGFAHGGFFALFSLLAAELFGLSSLGAILGTIICAGTIGGAIGPALAGYIFDVTSSYQAAFLICAVIGTVGLVLTTILTPVTGECGQNRVPFRI